MLSNEYLEIFRHKQTLLYKAAENGWLIMTKGIRINPKDYMPSFIYKVNINMQIYNGKNIMFKILDTIKWREFDV